MPSSRTAAGAAAPAAAAAKGKLALRVGQLTLELAALVDDRGEPLDHLVGRDLEQLGRLAHALVLRGEIGPRRLARQRLDAAHAGGDRALADDLEQADIAGAPDMGAAAQLDGISVSGALAVGVDAHRDDAHLLAIFLAEQRQRALWRWPHRASSDAVSTAEFCRIMALTRSSTARISSCVIGFWCEKSNLSRPGSTSEPFCATWDPSTWRSASCNRWVAE